MKKPLLLFITAIFLLSEYAAYAQPYHYPVRPGDSLWRATSSYVERVRLCNIPENKLRNMSTQDLIVSVLWFPYIRNLILNDNFLDAFDYMSEIYNGLDELTERIEAPQLLLNLYYSDSLKYSIQREILLENMLSLPFTLSNLNNIRRNGLLDSCLAKIGRRLEKEHFLNEKSLVSGAFLLVRLLSYLDNGRYSDFANRERDVKTFSETSQYPDRATINKIIYEAVMYKNRER